MQAIVNYLLDVVKKYGPSREFLVGMIIGLLTTSILGKIF